VNRLAAGLSWIAGTGAACVAYGTFIERRWYRLRRVDVPGVLTSSTGMPLRILHLSDLHFDPPEPRLTAFLEAVAREPFDLLAITGDLLGWTGAEDACVALIASVARGRPGVAVLGSNDVYGPKPKSPTLYFTDPEARRHGARLDTPRLIAGLQDGGITVLRGATTVLDTPAGLVEVGGLDDPHLADTALPDPAAVTPDPDVDAVLRLGLSHAPYRAALDLLSTVDYHVLLAGHTHGGQVRLPGIGALVTNSDLPRSQARGLSGWATAVLHVSPGLGTSRYAPFRFACRPEATLLTLT